MRLSKRSYKIIELMREHNYVWLSDLSLNGQYRFRNKMRKGFAGFIKVEGLTFLTARVAKHIEQGTCSVGVRKTVSQQLADLEKELQELERENYRLKHLEVEGVPIIDANDRVIDIR